MQTPTRFRSAGIDDRQVAELIGIARGLLADGSLNDSEIQFLRKWLVASEGITGNPLLVDITNHVEDVLADGIVTPEERSGLMRMLDNLCNNDFEIGEALKPGNLPLCSPPPVLYFSGERYCFTGTFTFGQRKDCEQIVQDRGAIAGSLTKKTTVLVIGDYATESWAQSSFGRKIEKAVTMRTSGVPIHIVAEKHWRNALDL